MTWRRFHNFCWGLLVWTLPVASAAVLAATVGEALLTQPGLVSLDLNDLLLLAGAMFLVSSLGALYRRRVAPDRRFNVRAYEAFYLIFWSTTALTNWPWNEAWGIAAAIMAASSAFDFLLRILEDYGFNLMFGSLFSAFGLLLLLSVTADGRPQIEIALGVHEISLWGVGYLAALAYLCVFTFEVVRALWRTLRGEMLPARYANTDHQSSG